MSAAGAAVEDRAPSAGDHWHEPGRCHSLRERRRGVLVRDLVIPGRGLTDGAAASSLPDASGPLSAVPTDGPLQGGGSLEEWQLRVWAEAHGLDGPDGGHAGGYDVSAEPVGRGVSAGDKSGEHIAGELPPSAPLSRLWNSLTRRSSPKAGPPALPQEGSAPAGLGLLSPEKPGAALVQAEERRSQALSLGQDPAQRLLLAEGARRLPRLTRMRTRPTEHSAQVQAHRLDKALQRRTLAAHPPQHKGLSSAAPSPTVPKSAPAAAWPGGLPRTPSAPSWLATPRVAMSGPLLWASNARLAHVKSDTALAPQGRLEGGDDQWVVPQKSPPGLSQGSPRGPCLDGTEDSEAVNVSGPSVEYSSPSGESSRDGSTTVPGPAASQKPMLRSGSDVYLPMASTALYEGLSTEVDSAGWAHGSVTAEEGDSQGAVRGRPLEAQLHSIEVTKLFLGPEVAAGSFGRIFRGKYKSREVAVKVLRMSASQEAEDAMARQFENEVAILSQLEHPNIVQFVGAYCAPPVRVVVMEFCRGGSVRQWLRRRGGELLPPLQLLDMAADIAHGGAYLHSRGVVHRDLKTENLLFTAGGTIKLADFGEGVRLGPSGTVRGEIGTYRWMAPEVLAGKAYGCAVDVYSFALVLWELLTLQLPFPDMTGIQAAYAVVAKDARPPIPVHCRPALERVITACWAGNPRKRPTFCNVLAMLARAAAELEQDDAGGPRPRYVMRCC